MAEPELLLTFRWNRARNCFLAETETGASFSIPLTDISGKLREALLYWREVEFPSSANPKEVVSDKYVIREELRLLSQDCFVQVCGVVAQPELPRDFNLEDLGL